MDDKNTVSDDERRRFEEQLAAASKKVGSASSDLNNSVQSTSSSLSNGVDSLAAMGGGLVTFGKSIVSSQGNLGKIGEGVDSASSSIGGALMALGPFGFIIGGLIKIVGKLVGAVLKTDQQLIDNYDKLADLGGQTNFTTEKLRELAIKTGQSLNGEYFDKLVKTTQSLGTTLLTLGKTSGQGMEAFMEVAKYSSTTATELRNLGITYDKFNEIQADYFRLESKLGLQRNKNTDTLHKETKVYAQSLIELAAVTGLSTEQIRKNQQKEMEDFAWNVKMREMSTTDEGKLRAKMLNDLIGSLREAGGSVDADALKDILSNGFTTTAASNQMITRAAAAGGDYIQWVEQLRKDGDYESFLLKTQEANKKTLNTMGVALKADKDAQAALGMGVDQVAILSKMIEKGTRKKVNQDTEDAKKAKGRNNDLLNLQNEADKLSRQFNQALDVLTSLISGPVNTALNALFYGLKALTKGILQFLVERGLAVDPALPYLFDTQEEIAAQLKEIPKELAKNQQAVNRAESTKYADPEVGGQAVLMAEDWKRSSELKQIGLRKAAKLMGMNLEEEQKQNKDQKEQQNKEKKEQDAKNKKEEKAPEKKKEEVNQKVEVKPEPKKEVPNEERPSKPYPAEAKPKPSAAVPNTTDFNPGFSKGGISRGPKSGYNVTLHGTEAIIPMKDDKTIPVSDITKLGIMLKDLPVKSVGDQYEKLLDDIKNIVMVSNNKTLTDILNQKKDEKKNEFDKKDGFLAQKIDDFKTIIAAHMESYKNKSNKSDNKESAKTQSPDNKKSEKSKGLEGSVPLPSGMNIPISFRNLPTDLSPKAESVLSQTDEVKSILENYMENLSSKIETFNKTEPVVQKQQKVTPALLEVVTSRMDTLLDRMKENTNIQSELLQISKA